MNRATIEQTFSKKSNNVYCSDFIKSNPLPSFEKIVHNYETELPETIEISFNHRDYHFAIYQYIKFGYFKKVLNKKSNGSYEVALTFLSPNKWNDPCESVLYQPNINIGGDLYRVSCFCSTLEPTESEESAWNRNKRECETDRKTVRVAYDFNSFCALLEKLAKKYAVNFYLCIADYSNSRDYFNKPKSEKKYSSLEGYLNDLSRKRKAFAYENEMRIFAVQKNPDVSNGVNDADGIYTFRTDLNDAEVKEFFHSVTLPPLPPFTKDDPRAFYYNRIQDLDNFDLRIGLRNLYSFQIAQSHLYELNGKSNYANDLVKEYNKP
jgi:hypothetical protein